MNLQVWNIVELYGHSDDLNPSIDVYLTSSCDCADTKNEKHKEALRKLLITNLHYNISHRCNLRGQKKYQFIFLSRLCNLPSSKDNTEEADQGKNRHGNLDYGIESHKTIYCVQRYGMKDTKKNPWSYYLAVGGGTKSGLSSWLRQGEKIKEWPYRTKTD